MHTLLHSVFKHAMKKHHVHTNPVEFADVPQKAEGKTKSKTERLRDQTRTPQELRRFLAATADHRLGAAFRLAASTGMRRGEVAGLRWDDLELDKARLWVKSPRVSVRYKVVDSEAKGHRKERPVALDPATVAALKAHRKRQAEERLAWGPDYQDSGYVFGARRFRE